MNDRKPATTQDDRVLDEIRSTLDGYPAGTFGPDDGGLAPMHPGFVHQKMREYRRGGLPSSSVPEAVSGTRTPTMPVTQITRKDGSPIGPPRLADPTDDDLLRDGRSYSSLLLTALSNLRMARAIENRWCIAAEPVPDVPLAFCSNCAEPLKGTDAGRGKKRPAKCYRCRHWPKEHGGAEYPHVRTDGKQHGSAA